MTSENPQTPTNDDLPQIKTGLSPTLKALGNDRARGRRGGVLASDSEYVKLAKQGGHKGLLWHDESPNTSSPHSYKAPDWFSTVNDGNGNLSEHKRSPRAFQRREPPFWSDNMSTWERKDSSARTENNYIPDYETEKLPSQNVEHSKFRRTVFDKKPVPVDMSTLLSFGYMGESKPTA